MNLNEMQNIEEITREVDYMGGVVCIPAHHNWVYLTVWNGKTVLMSSVNEPTALPVGYVVTGDHRILGEMSHQNTKGTLRKVGNLTTEEILLSNLEELSFKLRSILSDDSMTAEEKIHAVHCEKHGMIHDFRNHQAPTLVQYEQQQAIAAAKADVDAALLKYKEVKDSFKKPRVRVQG